MGNLVRTLIIINCTFENSIITKLNNNNLFFHLMESIFINKVFSVLTSCISKSEIIYFGASPKVITFYTFKFRSEFLRNLLNQLLYHSRLKLISIKSLKKFWYLISPLLNAKFIPDLLPVLNNLIFKYLDVINLKNISKVKFYIFTSLSKKNILHEYEVIILRYLINIDYMTKRMIEEKYSIPNLYDKQFEKVIPNLNFLTRIEELLLRVHQGDISYQELVALTYLTNFSILSKNCKALHYSIVTLLRLTKFKDLRVINKVYYIIKLNSKINKVILVF